MRFWDSSAVVPLLVHQPTSARTDRWLADDPAVSLWTLTPVEITSALWCLVRDGRCWKPTRSSLRLERSRWPLPATRSPTSSQSRRRLLRVHTLRAADALQLGAALVWANGRPQGKTPHTLDDRLALAARREGFEVP